MTTTPLIQRSRTLLLPAALALTLVAAGCGSDSGSEPPGDPGPTTVATDDAPTLPDGPIPVEPDGGIGDGAGPPGGLDGQPIPIDGDDDIGDGSGPPGEPMGADVIFDVTWTLTDAEIDGESLELDPDNPVTLVIGHENARVDPTKLKIGGTAACNSYGGQAFFDGGTIFEAGPLSQTEMGCDPAIMAIESAYTAALSATTAIEIGDGTITLEGPTSSLTYTVR